MILIDIDNTDCRNSEFVGALLRRALFRSWLIGAKKASKSDLVNVLGRVKRVPAMTSI